MASKAQKRRHRKAFARPSSVVQGANGAAVVRLVDGRRVVLTGVPYQPEKWGPVKERPASKRARTWVVDSLSAKGLIGPAEVAAGKEIAAVFAVVTGSLGARAQNLDAAGGAGCAEASASIALIKVKRYDPWCDALSRIQKLGGGPVLGVTIDRVCLQLGAREVERAHRMSNGGSDSYVIEALRLYVSMGREARKPAILRKRLDSSDNKRELSDRSRKPRPDDEAAAA